MKRVVYRIRFDILNRFPVNEKSALRKERLCYKNNSNGKAICQELPVNSNRETKKQVVIATEYAYNDKRI